MYVAKKFQAEVELRLAGNSKLLKQLKNMTKTESWEFFVSTMINRYEDETGKIWTAPETPEALMADPDMVLVLEGVSKGLKGII